jgi:hypothetical protein
LTPSDVFWTGLFTFGGSAAGAGAGFATALAQRRTEDGRLRLEEQKVAAAGDERRAESLERFQQERREIYLRYLNSLDGILSPVFQGEVDAASLRDRFDALMEAHCELELAGTKEMNQHGYVLNEQIEALTLALRHALERDASDEELVALLTERAEDFRGSRRALVQLMNRQCESALAEA